MKKLFVLVILLSHLGFGTHKVQADYVPADDYFACLDQMRPFYDECIENGNSIYYCKKVKCMLIFLCHGVPFNGIHWCLGTFPADDGDDA